MIRTILFDLSGTLVDSADAFRAAEKHAQHRIFGDLRGKGAVSSEVVQPLGGAPRPAQPLLPQVSRDTFLAAYRKLRKQCQDVAANFPRPEMWAEVYRHFDREPDSRQLLAWELDYWESVRNATTLFPETIQVLERLRRDYTLGLVTNRQGPGVSEAHTLARFPELEQLFQVTVVAGEGDIPAKPNAAPFALCLERLGATADNAVFVGDDWQVDIIGARAVGIEAIWLKHHTVHRTWPEVGAEQPAPVIDRLDALLDLASVLDREMQ